MKMAKVTLFSVSILSVIAVLAMLLVTVIAGRGG